MSLSKEFYRTTMYCSLKNQNPCTKYTGPDTTGNSTSYILSLLQKKI